MMTTIRLTGIVIVCQMGLNGGFVKAEVAIPMTGSKSILIDGDEQLQHMSRQKESGVTGGPGTSMEDAYVFQDRRFTAEDALDQVVIRNTSRYLKIVRVSITGSRERAPLLGGLVVENCRNVHLQDCRVTGTKGLFIHKSKDFSVTGCHLESNSRVYVFHSSHGQFLRNTIAKNLEKGLMLANSSHILVEDNEVHENAAEGIVAWGHGGLKPPQPPSPTHHITIRNNRVSRNNWHGIGTEFGQDSEISGNVLKGNVGYGINVGSWAHRNHVFDNVIEDTAGQGIIVETSQDSVFERNTVRRSGDNGFWLINSSGTIVRNNDISHAHTGIKVEFRTDGRHALEIRQHPDGTENRIENNRIEHCFVGAQISSSRNTCAKNEFMHNRDALVLRGKMNVVEENRILTSVNGLTNYGDDNRIENNIFDNASNAIVIRKGRGNQILGNRMLNICFDNIEVRTDGHENTIAANTIQTTAPGITLRGKRNIIEKNTIVSVGWFYSTPGGIVINGGADNVIRRNTFTSSMIGITCMDGSGNEITNNTFRENETAIWLDPAMKEKNVIKDNVYDKNDKDRVDTNSPPGSRVW